MQRGDYNSASARAAHVQEEQIGEDDAEAEIAGSAAIGDGRGEGEGEGEGGGCGRVPAHDRGVHREAVEVSEGGGVDGDCVYRWWGSGFVKLFCRNSGS